MKKFFSLMCAILLCSMTAIYAEDEQKEEASKSEAVEFQQTDGKLIVKDFYPETTIKGVSFQVLILKDMVDFKKVGCLRLKTKYFSNYTSDTFIGTLDYDEISACIQSLNFLKDNVLNTIPTHYTECEYKTRDGVKVGAYYNQDKSAWTIYVQTKSYSSRSIAYMNVSNIYEIIAAMEQAKADIAAALAE